MTEIEIVGPKVAVDRDGTSDAGGGQLLLKEGKLMVRASTIERPLGAVSAISEISIVDLARQRARVRFVDGVVWNIASEGDEVYAFLKQVESAAGRPGLVAPPPKLSQAVREAATPQRRRWAAMTVVALLMFVPFRMLAGLSASAGHAMALGLLVLLGVVVVAIGLRDGGPAILDGVRARLASFGPVPVVALLIAAAAGSAMGASDAEAAGHQASEHARRVRVAEAKAQREAARLEAEAAKKKKAVAAVVAELESALSDNRLREVREARERLRALDAKHPALSKGGADLDGAIAKVDEEDRVAGLQKGLRAVRRMARDRLRCENAKGVSDAWKQLNGVRTSDAEYEQIARAVAPLERCRKRVASRFAASAEDGRRQQRMQMAPALEGQLRGLGYPTSVTLAGKRQDRLVVAADQLDDNAVARITALTDDEGVAFLDKRAKEGVRQVRFRGKRLDKRFDLEPESTRVLTAPLLERFGLGAPLELAATPPANPESPE